MNYRELIEKINKRLGELALELDSADAARIEAIEEEVRSLKAEREKHTKDMATAARAAFENGTEVRSPAPVAADETISRMTKRDKLALVVGRQARNKSFNDAEKRALGTALTTTASAYIAASEMADGVNNAGVFIPVITILEFLKEEGKISPILADLAITSVPGLSEFPYRKTRDKARAKAEGAKGSDNQMEWDKLTGTKGYLQTIMVVTDEILALTDFDFGAYIINQMLQDLNEDWVEDLVYGSGSDNHIKGISVDATAAVAGGYSAGKGLEALIAGVKLCKGKYRRGAKVYVAQDLYDEVLFSVDDNGNFKYPIFNNASGITSIGPIRIELDENLKDGDFIIGNVNKFYKVNALIPIRIETDRKPRYGLTEYVASEYCATAAYPGAFVHGYKKA